MMLVTVSSGNVGGALIRRLAADGVPVRVLRRPESASALPAGVEAVTGDLDRPASLRSAFAAIDTVFLLAPGPDVVAQEAVAIAAAAEAGVKRIVMLSSGGVEDEVGSGPLHAPGERALRATGMAWTILRPAEFMSNALMWSGMIRDHGAFYASTGNGRSAMIHPHDIAAAAAAVLTRSGHDHQHYPLTGPEALTRAELADALTWAVGKPIRYVEITDAAFREQMRASGVPPFIVDPVARFYEQVRAGGAARIEPALAKLTGDPGRSFAAWARENAEAFR
jgi:uncharacterized protein YbjT (DUF2867 family)